MNLRIPKAVALQNKREELRDYLLRLTDIWYSGIELGEIFWEKSNYMTSIRKHGKNFSIWEKKCDLFIEKSKKILNSLNEKNDLSKKSFKETDSKII